VERYWDMMQKWPRLGRIKRLAGLPGKRNKHWASNFSKSC